MSAEIAKTLKILAATLRHASQQLDELAEKSVATMPEYRKRVRQTPKAAILRAVLTKMPGLDIYQLVQGLQKEGYKFVGGDPVGSTRALIYSRPGEFRNEGGLFYLVNQPAPTPEERVADAEKKAQETVDKAARRRKK